MFTPGIYRGKVTEWGLGEAKTGTFQFQLRVKVEEVAKNEDDLAAGFKPLDKAVTKTVFLPITQGTKDFVLEDLKFLGYDRKALSSAALIPGSPASFDFKDRLAVIQCTIEAWNGRDREKFRICRRKASAAFGREQQSQFDGLFAQEDKEIDLDGVPI